MATPLVVSFLLGRAASAQAPELPKPSEPAAVLQPAEPQKPAEPRAVFSPDRPPKDEPVSYAQAISLAFGATFFNEVRISTAGPVVELSRLAHEGFYKRELITLLLICGKAKKPLHEAAAARKKGKSLRELARSYGLDYDAVYDAALAVEETVDKSYLPRFPERRPRKDRDEP